MPPPHPLAAIQKGAGALVGKIGVHKRSPPRPDFVVWCRVMLRLAFVGLVVIGSIGLAGCDSGPVTENAPTHTDSLGRAVPTWVHNDADLLVYRCGQPDRILDTSEDDPRPLIPTRILTYRKAHLKIAYVPSDSVDQAPPYHWKLMGLIDTRTNHAIDASELRSTLEKRLPCMLRNPQ